MFYFIADKESRKPEGGTFNTFAQAVKAYEKKKAAGENVILCWTNNRTVRIVIEEDE